MKLQTFYPGYFRLTINQRINARQKRNGLNINGLIRATITAVSAGYITSQDANTCQVNNGLYHRSGKSHSFYPNK